MALLRDAGAQTRIESALAAQTLSSLRLGMGICKIEGLRSRVIRVFGAVMF